MLQAARQPFVAVHVVGSCLLLRGGSSCAWRLGFWSLVSGAVPGGRLACDLGGMFEPTLASPSLSDPEDELLLSSKSIRIGTTKNCAAAAARLLPRQRHRVPRANSRNLCFRCRSLEAGRQASAKARGPQSRPQIAASPKFLQRALFQSGLLAFLQGL